MRTLLVLAALLGGMAGAQPSSTWKDLPDGSQSRSTTDSGTVGVTHAIATPNGVQATVLTISNAVWVDPTATVASCTAWTNLGMQDGAFVIQVLYGSEIIPDLIQAQQDALTKQGDVQAVLTADALCQKAVVLSPGKTLTIPADKPFAIAQALAVRLKLDDRGRVVLTFVK
ncbi:hypothetical protein MF271_22620 (plasmid) [Deinococcus sp. KNUC1210]|uniref:hypothetical protein n=1 Tax=Deinococcus sp. KNUC1210 TaxID=2917691 RepID=UPI001EF06E55|nr:hypothetical protein [Deinococcus sp. KNUC1210]ULH18262.1 hypothetical protein MF271_22620 [Deinococcus sp. KNUC1210]